MSGFFNFNLIVILIVILIVFLLLSLCCKLIFMSFVLDPARSPPAGIFNIVVDHAPRTLVCTFLCLGAVASSVFIKLMHDIEWNPGPPKYGAANLAPPGRGVQTHKRYSSVPDTISNETSSKFVYASPWRPTGARSGDHSVVMPPHHHLNGNLAVASACMVRQICNLVATAAERERQQPQHPADAHTVPPAHSHVTRGRIDGDHEQIRCGRFLKTELMQKLYRIVPDSTSRLRTVWREAFSWLLQAGYIQRADGRSDSFEVDLDRIQGLDALQQKQNPDEITELGFELNRRLGVNSDNNSNSNPTQWGEVDVFELSCGLYSVSLNCNMFLHDNNSEALRNFLSFFPQVDIVFLQEIGTAQLQGQFGGDFFVFSDGFSAGDMRGGTGTAVLVRRTGGVVATSLAVRPEENHSGLQYTLVSIEVVVHDDNNNSKNSSNQEKKQQQRRKLNVGSFYLPCSGSEKLKAYSSQLPVGEYVDERERLLAQDLRSVVEEYNITLGGGDFNAYLHPDCSPSHVIHAAWRRAKVLLKECIDFTFLVPIRRGDQPTNRNAGLGDKVVHDAPLTCLDAIFVRGELQSAAAPVVSVVYPASDHSAVLAQVRVSTEMAQAFRLRIQRRAAHQQQFHKMTQKEVDDVTPRFVEIVEHTFADGRDQACTMLVDRLEAWVRRCLLACARQAGFRYGQAPPRGSSQQQQQENSEQHLPAAAAAAASSSSSFVSSQQQQQGASASPPQQQQSNQNNGKPWNEYAAIRRQPPVEVVRLATFLSELPLSARREQLRLLEQPLIDEERRNRINNSKLRRGLPFGIDASLPEFWLEAVQSGKCYYGAVKHLYRILTLLHYQSGVSSHQDEDTLCCKRCEAVRFSLYGEKERAKRQQEKQRKERERQDEQQHSSSCTTTAAAAAAPTTRGGKQKQQQQQQIQQDSSVPAAAPQRIRDDAQLLTVVHPVHHLFRCEKINSPPPAVSGQPLTLETLFAGSLTLEQRIQLIKDLSGWFKTLRAASQQST